MGSYGNLPSSATIPISPFSISIPDEALTELKTLIKLAKLPPKTYESSFADNRFGISHEWMVKAKKEWEYNFDWRKHEAEMNENPHFLATVQDDDGKDYSVHFTGLFSQATDAIPLVLLHGWPGSFLEFLPLLNILKSRYTPSTLPYHVIVPSLVGFGFSSPLPIDQDWEIGGTARLIHKLMVGLRFKGYVAQGGDIGSRVARLLGVTYKECKTIHLNFCTMSEPKSLEGSISKLEEEGLKRGREFYNTGTAYQAVHATRPSTIDFVMASSPIALLAWIGEKFLSWTDEDPPLSTILESVSLYWLCPNNFSGTIYTYRGYRLPVPKGNHDDPANYMHKPFGYSYFPKDVFPSPISWVKTTGNLVFSKTHTSGGHFACMEKPEVMLDDIEEFLKEVWPTVMND